MDNFHDLTDYQLARERQKVSQSLKELTEVRKHMDAELDMRLGENEELRVGKNLRVMRVLSPVKRTYQKFLVKTYLDADQYDQVTEVVTSKVDDFIKDRLSEAKDKDQLKFWKKFWQELKDTAEEEGLRKSIRVTPLRKSPLSLDKLEDSLISEIERSAK